MKKDTHPIKIVVTGPESTGKSSMCQALADHFHTLWLPEYAREYLDRLDRPYTKDDLDHIALGQKSQEDNMDISRKIHVVDTSFEVLKIWSEWKYQDSSPTINELFDGSQVDLYLLMYPDLPWEDDPLRENPDDRLELFEIYKNLLHTRQLPHEIIKGSGDNRLKNAVQSLGKNFDLDL